MEITLISLANCSDDDSKIILGECLRFVNISNYSDYSVYPAVCGTSCTACPSGCATCTGPDNCFCAIVLIF